jgi:hypothetical protein
MPAPIISNVDATMTKHAADVLSIKVDCTAWLNDAAALAGDTVSNVSFSSILGTVSASMQTQNASEFIALVSGGNPGQADTLDMLVDTTNGRRETLRVRVNVLV